MPLIRMLILVPCLVLSFGRCATGGEPDSSGGAASRYLYVWSASADGEHNDFVSVWDVDPGSKTYGGLLSTLDVGAVAHAHHTEHFMPEGDLFFANGFMTGQSFVINVADPTNPFLAARFTNAGPYTFPHSFERTPSGSVLSTFQNKGDSESGAGGLVELDPMGRFIRGSDAADPADPDLRPYSVTPLPHLNRVVTTTGDMWGKLEGKSVQIWSLSDLELLHTLPLPPGPRGDEHLDVAEARVLEDGKTLIVTTFRCGIYVLSGVEGDAPAIHWVKSLPFESYEAGDQCSVPWRYGQFWVQTNEGRSELNVFDMSDPWHPRAADTLVLDGPVRPHWISGELDGDRIALTGGQGWLAGRVVVLRLDRNSGQLSLIEDLRTPGSPYPGLDMTRVEWPHGNTGAAVPHGAIFSRD